MEWEVAEATIAGGYYHNNGRVTEAVKADKLRQQHQRKRKIQRNGWLLKTLGTEGTTESMQERVAQYDSQVNVSQLHNAFSTPHSRLSAYPSRLLLST